MHKATDSAPVWHEDSTTVATRVNVHGASCSEAAALALLHSPGFKHGQDELLREQGNCSDYSNTFFTDERTGMPQKCRRLLQIPIMLNKYLEQEQQWNRRPQNCFTSLIAALKRLKVAEFTVWTGITSFNFLLSIKKTFSY